jgi:hypothetical protein
MSDDFADFAREQDETRSTWLPPLAWSLIVLLAFLAFELTAQPAISAVVLCCKFGWNDLKTGVWLRRRDPWPARGRACSWFCWAWGLTKVALAAFVCGILVVVLEAILEGNGAGQRGLPPHSFIGAITLLLIAMPVETLIATVGCVVARKAQVRVWIGNPLHRARETGQWPPLFPLLRLDNVHNGAVWARAAMIAVLIAINLTLSVIVALALHPVIGVFAFGAGLVAAIALTRGAVASDPRECWGADCDFDAQTYDAADEN